MESDSVDLIVSSLPFAMQYRYTPSYNDFGHTDDDAHFFQQMDFLTPELLRVLAPGRVAAIHCKDRIVEGARSGLGFQTVSPFGARVLFHFQQHGFAYLGTKLIPTDVVRENAQTNRLGWTEQCKDGSRMGAGLIEYLHLFRKPQTDRGRGYADVPVVKLKKEWDKDEKCWRVTDPRTDEEAAADDSRLAYSRAAWQIDAAGLQRSNGNRLLTPAEFALLPVRGVWRAWREQCLTQPYDYAHHVAVGEALDARGKLKPEFAVIPAHVEHPDVWSIARMRTLNLEQRLQNRAAHLCPLPLDIAERAIRLHSMPGESVFDPFGGLMTVPYVAVKLGRRGVGCELNADYFADGVRNCEAAERGVAVPTLFDLLAADEADDAPAVVDDAEAS
jgi:hypothetical protein